MRWNRRSEPERSTRTAMPGYFASKPCANPLGDRQVHGGVEGELAFLLRRLDQRRRDGRGSGAAARNGEAKQPAAIAAEAFSRLRLEKPVAIIEILRK